jgi:hypothetical protein
MTTFTLHWNYRILYNGEIHSLGEIYYNADGKPAAFTFGGVLDDWEELADLVGTYKLIETAFAKPVVRVDTENELILGEMGNLQ